MKHRRAVNAQKIARAAARQASGNVQDHNRSQSQVSDGAGGGDKGEGEIGVAGRLWATRRSMGRTRKRSISGQSNTASSSWNQKSNHERRGVPEGGKHNHHAHTVMTGDGGGEEEEEEVEVLPEFASLHVIIPPQSAGLVPPPASSPNWHAALGLLEREMDRVEFDVALIGAGAFGEQL